MQGRQRPIVLQALLQPEEERNRERRHHAHIDRCFEKARGAHSEQEGRQVLAERVRERDGVVLHRGCPQEPLHRPPSAQFFVAAAGGPAGLYPRSIGAESDSWRESGFALHVAAVPPVTISCSLVYDQRTTAPGILVVVNWHEERRVT